MDSGATHYMTPDINNLQQSTPYYGHEQVIIGNGKSFLVLHIGSCSFQFSSSTFPIKLNFVHVLHLSHNLISIAKLCHDNVAFVEFHPDFFCFFFCQRSSLQDNPTMGSSGASGCFTS